MCVRRAARHGRWAIARKGLTIENLHLRHRQPNDSVLGNSHISHVAGRLLLLAGGLRRGGAGRVVHMVAAQHGHHAHRQVGSHHAPCAGAKRTHHGLNVKVTRPQAACNAACTLSDLRARLRQVVRSASSQAAPAAAPAPGMGAQSASASRWSPNGLERWPVCEDKGAGLSKGIARAEVSGVTLALQLGIANALQTSLPKLMSF